MRAALAPKVMAPAPVMVQQPVAPRPIQYSPPMSVQTPTGLRLPPAEEQQFQQWATGLPWYHEFQQQYGEAPDLNDPDYDYRRAWKAGVVPERYEYDKGMYHWPSDTPDNQPLKGENHPTKWMGEFMKQTGRDPNELGITDPQQAEKYLKGKKK